MKRIAWATDIHLDCLDGRQIDAFCSQIRAARVQALLLCGDISQAPTLANHLRILEKALACEIYFVLGNHDYYHGSIADVRGEIRAVMRNSARLHWLPATGVVELGRDVGLVGHDGWADGGFGDFDASPVAINDYKLILDLAGLPKQARKMMIGRLGREAADYLLGVLVAALDRYREVIVLTHAPPFKEACRYQGIVANDEWLPHFSCKAVGDVLCEAMRHRPDRCARVLCGHTHHHAEIFPLPNLRVETGAAEYGNPQVQAVFRVD